MSTTTTLSKSQRAYQWIRQRITDHVFTPGYRLVLGTIAADLDMSVVPVREAIRQLEAEGLVTYEHNVGARVTVVDEAEYVHTMQTLGLVEGCATALAAPHLTPVDLDAAQAINDRMRQGLSDFDAHEFTRLNERFHSVLFAHCPNPHILDLVERGWRQLPNVRDSTFAYVPDRAVESVREHDQILDLIREGASPLDIELAARHHRWRTMDAFITARHPDRQPGDRPSTDRSAPDSSPTNRPSTNRPSTHRSLSEPRSGETKRASPTSATPNSPTSPSTPTRSTA